MRSDTRPAESEAGPADLPVLTADTITDDQIHKLWSTTADPQIADCCRAALGIGSPIWPVKQAAREAVAEELNAIRAEIR